MIKHALTPGLMIAGAGFLVVNDALVKVASQSLPNGQIIAIRSAVIALICLCLIALFRRSWSRPFDRDVMIRTGFTVGNVFVFVAALSALPFAVAVMVDFINILYVALLAPLVLPERMTFRKLSSVLIGLSGAMVILSPEFRAFGWVIALPLISSLLGAGREIWTRRLGPGHSPEVLTLYAVVVMMLVAVLTSAPSWTFDNLQAHGIAALAGAFLAAAMILMTAALQHGDATFVTPFRLTALVWTILLSLLLFGETIGAAQVIGSGFIAGALLILLLTPKPPSETGIGT